MTVTQIIVGLALMWSIAQPNETIHRYGGDADWQLARLRGAAVNFDAGIVFPARNRIAGHGPCNRFTATNHLPYPWIDIVHLASTRRMCPEAQAEARYFDALKAAETSVIADGQLTLSTEDGAELAVFTAVD